MCDLLKYNYLALFIVVLDANMHFASPGVYYGNATSASRHMISTCSLSLSVALLWLILPL